MKFHYFIPLLLTNIVIIQATTFQNQTISLSKKYPKTYKVYNGFKCTATAYPFFVSICDYKERIHCGGTILAPNIILTAAHCTLRMEKQGLERFHVVANPHSKNAQHIRIKKYINHRKYNKIRTQSNDISLFILKENIRNAVKIQILSEPYQDDIIQYCDIGLTMGWGSYTHDEKLPDDLMCARLPLLPISKCIKKYGERVEKVRNFVACTLSYREADVCIGDSGGPLICESEERQIGIVSYGPPCGAQQGRPGVWYRPDRYLKWIKWTIKNETTSSRQARSSNKKSSAKGLRDKNNEILIMCYYLLLATVYYCNKIFKCFWEPHRSTDLVIG